MNKSRFFCSVSTLAAVLAFGAAGQAAAQAPTPAPAGEVSEVVVTGSFIRGTPEDAALPVDVIGADELQKQGSPNTVELIKSLTVSNGVLGDTNQFDARAQGAEGSATINLRGLGPARTLVLWNGHRLVNAPTLNGNSPDINVLPMAAVGRIEVLKDGAAATYGSDAIGGVVNFITRKNVDGLELSGSYRWIDGSDGDWDGSAVWGKTWDNLNVLLTAGYQHRSELSVRERDFTSRTYFQAPEAYSTGNSITTFLPLGSSGPVAGLQRDVGCAPLGGTPLITSGVVPTCAFNFVPYDNLIEKENRWQIYGEANYTFSDTMKAHLEGFYSETDTPEWATSPSYLAIQSPTTATNPFFPVLPGLGGGYFVPASNPGFALYRTQNPTQIPGSATGAFFPGLFYRPLAEGGNPLFGDGASRGSRKFKAWRVSGGLTGEFANGWGYDLTATYMHDNLVRIGYDTLVDRFQLALRGLGGAGCNPATGTPGVGGCQYFNPFSNAIQSNFVTGQINPNFNAAVANDPELIRWFFIPIKSDLTSRLLVLDAVFNGETGIQLPGGPVAWAAGGQFRRQEYEATYDDIFNTNINPCIDTPFNGNMSCTARTGPFMFLGTATPADLDGDVWAAFAEASLPITDTLQAQLAARYEDYGDKGGSTFNPKLSVRWQINDIFAVRGSVGTTFRAPPLTSLDPGQVTSLQFLGGAFRAVDVFGNPDLEPEKATTYSVGAIAKVGGFRATVDYWNFDFTNPLVAEPVGGIFASMFPTTPAVTDPAHPCNNAAFAGLRSRFSFSGGACSGPTVSRIATFYVNGPGIKTDGIDILADYEIDQLGPGRGHIGGSLTYVRKYSVEATTVEGIVVTPAFDGVGHLNYQTQIYPVPEWKAAVFGEYTQGPHNLRVTVNYISSYVDQRPAPFAPNVAVTGAGQTLVFSNRGQKIDSYTTVDASYRLLLPWDTTVVFTVDNIFNQDPSFARLELGYDPFTGNPLGRNFKLNVTKKF